MLSVLSDMLKGSNKEKFKGMRFKLTDAAQEVFNTLKIAFTSALMLIHFNPEWKIRVETDAFGFAISAIMLQLNIATGVWHPVAF